MSNPACPSMARRGVGAGNDQAYSGEKKSVVDLIGVGIVFRPPRFLTCFSGWLLQFQFFIFLLCFLLRNPEVIVIKHTEGLDDVGDGNSSISNQEKILSVLQVGWL